MNTRKQSKASLYESSRHQASVFKRVPLAQAIAVIVATGLIGAQSAYAQQVFSKGWIDAQRGARNEQIATGRLPNGMPLPSSSAGGQQQLARDQLARSLGNINKVARTLAEHIAKQQIDRTAAQNGTPNVVITDGLGGNGLVVDFNNAWQNAILKNQEIKDGKTVVTIDQSKAAAIAYWDSFNVGKNTQVHFDQHGNADWTILNKVSNSTAPSQIQGKITADGTVMIMNNNGVIFSGSSQINVRNLVAAAANISDDQFLNRGLYFDANGSQATFTNALGNIVVESGAQINTHAPKSATQGGGYVLLLGQEVHNAGEINTANGQTTLAAGDNFFIRKGVGTDGNAKSTTRGNEVATSFNVNSLASGKAVNTGIITSTTGDITLTGHDVQQSGIAIATTSTSTRGTIHLLNSLSDATGKVTLGKDSITAILLDDKSGTALDSQKDAGVKDLDGLPNPQAIGKFDNLGTLADRTDLSRIEITSGNTVEFIGDSLTLATGGQVAVTAKNRTLVRDDATIDVAGAVGVAVSMESNVIKVNIQGNEQRDAPVNREGGGLGSNDVWVDVRDLILVPAGTNGYATDRWYTAGGLLEVSGYLANSGHTVGEWMAQGGTVHFSGKEVVTQANSHINLSGGTIDVASGYIKQSWLKGADGKLYEVSSAPGDLLYTGVHKGNEATSARWGVTKTYYNPLMANEKRFEQGYTVGRDAGKLIVATQSAVLEGKIDSDTYQGIRQSQTPQTGLDGYYQSHKATSRGAQLIIGEYLPVYNKDAGLVNYALNPAANKVILKETQERIAAGLDVTVALPSDRINTIILDTAQLNDFNLGAIKVAAKNSIMVDGDLSISHGGEVVLYGPQVDVNANITAHSGNIELGNVLKQYATGNKRIEDTTLVGAGTVNVADGVKLDASGLWTNLQKGQLDASGLPFVNAGKVAIRSTGDVTLGENSLINVSSGAVLGVDGKVTGGKGGDVTLQVFGATSSLALNGDIRSYGVNGGGKLAVQTNKVLISDAEEPVVAGTLVLDGQFFQKGFSGYDIIGQKGLTVAEGTIVDVAMPVYRVGADANLHLTGMDAASLLDVWTPPVYQENITKGTLTQRKGASLSLQAGSAASVAADMKTVSAVIGTGEVINVDPGQTISISSIGQLTVDGILNAWGGDIRLSGIGIGGVDAETENAKGHQRSILIGEHAVLDVAARAVSATDVFGKQYGQVNNGGNIVVGGTINHALGNATSPDLFVVVRDGAVLDASGTHAVLDIAGLGRTDVASNGGTISLASNNGVYLDGVMKAHAGGANAAGGTLSVALDSPMYLRPANTAVLNARELILTQTTRAHAPGEDPVVDGLVYGHGSLSVEQIHAGGFDNLSLLAGGGIAFEGDTTLNMRQNLQIYGRMLMAENAQENATINLAASYVRLASNLAASRDGHYDSARQVDIAKRNQSKAVHVDGNLIDIRGAVSFKSDLVDMVSKGDLRFVSLAERWNGQTPTTSLISNGDIVLRAAQLYPETATGAGVYAGYTKSSNGIVQYDPLRSLTIGRMTDTLPAMPYSAFGYLLLASANIEQGGVVRAPFGRIQLGVVSGQDDKTLSVNLLANSLTSVSGAGVNMPYGGTVDGQTWKYDGTTVNLGTFQSGVTMGSVAVDVKEGAVLDLSGGGELVGAGFISGRGGSTDARFNPLVQIGANGGFMLPGLGTNPVYAIVPGAQSYAPISGEHGANDPAIGRQITIGAGVPGLPAGTYTLMPSTYALMPGAFRVEINGLAGQGGTASAQAMRNGSWSLSGNVSIAGTTMRDSLSSQLIVTPANVLRTYSQYNETTFTDFAIADAARRGIPRTELPMDAKTLQLNLMAGAAENAFRFNGEGRFESAKGGYAGTVAVLMTSGDGRIEVVKQGDKATEGFTGITLHDESLNHIGAARMVIGGMPAVRYGQGGNYISFGFNAEEVHLRSGAHLYAPEVFLIAEDSTRPSSQGGLINIEQGASISTLGRGKAAFDANDGFVYQSAPYMVAVSNGLLNVTPYTGVAKGGIEIGTPKAGYTGDTTLYSEGTLLMSTNGRFSLDDAVRYGTRNLTLAVGAINVGSQASLADAESRGIRASGLAMDQAMLNRLLRGDTSTGAPAIETLVLSAANSVNFYGDVTLDTYDPVTGKSTLDRLVLSTQSMYGYGDANAVATIRTKNLVWGGSESPAGSIVANGAGTGSGTLNFNTERLEFGFGPFTQPGNVKSYDRLAVGFANVNMHASERLTANHQGGLSVYQSQGAYVEGKGFEYTGGNLTIITPLMTGQAGSTNTIVAGGNIHVSAPANTTADNAARTNDSLGATLGLHGKNVTIATKVALASGKLTLIADDDLTLTDAAYIDMAGRKVTFNDVDKYSWGGDVVLESRAGDIRQGAGSTIDLSAVHNKAGALSAVALDSAAGMVDLQGKIVGTSSGSYDAGGTMVPYKGGFITVRAQTLSHNGTLNDQFAQLNERLNQGGVAGGRSFQLKQGDLTIGNEVNAGEVNVSLDNGSLTVNGKIDASGERVGTIRLSAKDGLTIGSNAVLDAHGTVLRVDSYGKIIDSPNRAIVELNSGHGTLTLADGAKIDVRHGTNATVGTGKGQNDGVARGTLTLNAPRIGSNGNYNDNDAATYGDIAMNATGAITIQGAKTIAINGMHTYNDARYGTDPSATGRPYQVIDQAYLDEKHTDSTKFMDAALANTNLVDNKLAGLNNATYADALHVRPGVEIVSATPDGDMIVRGDLDLSQYRYDSLNANNKPNGVYGSGEVGALTIRASGNLDIFGSINDGFAPPPVTNDDNGWLLLPGIDFNGGNIVVPGIGVTLAAGTTLPSGATLNYDVEIKAFALEKGVTLPVTTTLGSALNLPAGTILSGDVFDAQGTLLFAAGTKLGSENALWHFAAGTTFAAGSKFDVVVQFGVTTWSKGIPLPGPAGTGSTVVLNANTALGVGAIIPSGTDVHFIDGVESIALRPEVGGRQGQLWALAPMLAEGAQSWSMRLVAGADLDAADSRTVTPRAPHGDLRLADSHYGMYSQALPPKEGDIAYWSEQGAIDMGGVEGEPIDFDEIGWSDMCAEGNAPEYCVYLNSEYTYKASSVRASVVRTGMGDLDLVSGGNLAMETLFGVYTAGSSSSPTNDNDPFNMARNSNAKGAVLNDPEGNHEKLVNGGADSVYRAWYPDQGGNLVLQVGGNLTGANILLPDTYVGRPVESDSGLVSGDVGNWLWRQGSGATPTGGVAQPTAWWINFGTYVKDGSDATKMATFTGFGTLGGGNVDINVLGDAGMLSPFSGKTLKQSTSDYNQGLVLAVGSTGRISADGSMQLTGGGDLVLHVGGALNPLGMTTRNNGTVTNLRGHIDVDASQVGNLGLLYGNRSTDHVPTETRAFDAFTSTRGAPTGALRFVPGDATINMSTMGDQLVQEVIDPGRVKTMNINAFTDSDNVKGRGYSWFTLWTDHTAIDLFSVGGNVAPYVESSGRIADEAILYPSILKAVAATGSLYYGKAVKDWRGDANDVLPIMLMPAPHGQLDFLAANSIYAGGLSVFRSGADRASIATPQNPAYGGWSGTDYTGRPITTNTSVLGSRSTEIDYPMFAFGSASASADLGEQLAPSRFYALSGDLVGVSSGRTLKYTTLNWRARPDERNGLISYEGAGPVYMIAGRDIVSSGNNLGQKETLFSIHNSQSNLFVHHSDTDISVVSAGRDILYSTFNVAGPGTLEITAGRNILMEDKATVLSLGAVVPGDKRAGADIAMAAGVGAAGLNYAAFLAKYINPDNQAASGVPLSEQPGKVAKTYAQELVTWLSAYTGFVGSTEEALVAFNTLSSAQQRIFGREVYYAEIKAGGREYTNPESTRFNSYLRSRSAIAALFPTTDANGQAVHYNGGITMFGAAGVNTLFGGDIQMMTPGGKLVVGAEGAAPKVTNMIALPVVTPGVVTQGQGNIALYAHDSVLLGQSRIMTTFGGDIMAWSDTGDINAGRGSKTTVVFTPPKRTYDQWGNVTLAPQVPSSGAGIATLNPIAEVAAGDIDLIAPQGTIDAGEAGIRVSGNVNIAALHVVNADNIKVQGNSTGVPTMASVNVGALTNASAAAGSASAAAQDAMQRERIENRNNLPSVFSVRVLGFGNEPATGTTSTTGNVGQSANASGLVEVLGQLDLSEQALSKLTATERRNLAR